MEMIGFVGDFEVSDSAVGPGALFSFGNLGTDACFVPGAQRNADWEGLALPFSLAWGSLKI